VPRVVHAVRADDKVACHAASHSSE
jgi:hypothetical protein